MRIAWFSTAPSAAAQSRSDYFAQMVLPHIQKKVEIEFFGSAQGPSTHYLNAISRHRKQPFDVFFYQLEDGRDSYSTRMHLALMPGVVLFHDLFFTDDGPEPMLNSPWESVIKKFENPKLSWPDRATEHYREKPLGVREAGLAAISVFTNSRDHGEFKRLIRNNINNCRSHYLPLPIVTAEPSGIEEQQILFCGSTQVEDRAHHVLRALTKINAEAKNPWTLNWLLQDKEIEKMRAQELLSEFNVSNVKLIFGKSPEAWFEVLKSAHPKAVAIHMRVSALGHVQPYLNMSIGAGLKVICARFGEEVPQNLVFSIEPGLGEAQTLETLLQRFATSEVQWKPELQKEYIRESFSPEVIAQEFMSILMKSAEELKPFYKKWAAFEADAKSTLLNEINFEGDPLKPALEELGWV